MDPEKQYVVRHIQNGGFETGDFTGWILVGDTVNWYYNWYDVCNVVATEADYPGVVHSGNFGALLGQGGYAAKLAQTVPTTPGQLYLVSFWLADLQAVGFQQFSATWNGANFASLANPPAFDWTNFQFVATADDTNAALEFAAENDRGYFGFDDVTVTPVPPVAFTGYGICSNGFQVTWPTLAGLNYQVLSTTDLAQGNWTTNLIVACTNLTTFVDTNSPAGSAQEFYRLVLLPLP